MVLGWVRVLKALGAKLLLVFFAHELRVELIDSDGSRLRNWDKLELGGLSEFAFLSLKSVG